MTGRIDVNWSLVANYSHDNALIVKGVTNALFESSGPPGNRLASVPPNAANLWVKYDFSTRWKGVRLGTGVALVGQLQGDDGNDFQLPGYGRIDAMVGYQFAPSFLRRKKSLSFQLNVRNLLNKNYFESGSGFGTYSTDPTRNLRNAEGFRCSRDIRGHGWDTGVWIDGDTGALRHVFLPSGQHAGNTVSIWLWGLHHGDIRDSLPYRILVAFFGLILVILSVTGVYIWWKKRIARQRSATERNGQPNLRVESELKRVV